MTSYATMWFPALAARLKECGVWDHPGAVVDGRIANRWAPVVANVFAGLCGGFPSGYERAIDWERHMPPVAGMSWCQECGDLFFAVVDMSDPARWDVRCGSCDPLVKAGVYLVNENRANEIDDALLPIAYGSVLEALVRLGDPLSRSELATQAHDSHHLDRAIDSLVELGVLVEADDLIYIACGQRT